MVLRSFVGKLYIEMNHIELSGRTLKSLLDLKTMQSSRLRIYKKE